MFPGVGEVAAAVLIAELPELGAVDDRSEPKHGVSKDAPEGDQRLHRLSVSGA